jgi:Reverse transcriptase (RNA-dependent DNA polymerase)
MAPKMSDIPKLNHNGSNYDTWAYEFKAFCRFNLKDLFDLSKHYTELSTFTKRHRHDSSTTLKNLHPYLDQTNTSDDIERRSAMLHGALVLATSGEARERVRTACGDECNGFKAWDALRQRYEKSKYIRARNFTKQLKDLKCISNKHDDVEQFTYKFNDLMDRFAECDVQYPAFIQFTEYYDRLPPDIAHIFTANLGHNETIYEDTDILRKTQHIVLASIATDRHIVSTKSASASGLTAAAAQERPACTHCGKSNHTSDKCYRRPDKTQSSSKKSSDSPPAPCKHCKGPHWNKDCPTLKSSSHAKQAEASQPSSSESTNSGSANVATGHDSDLADCDPDSIAVPAHAFKSGAQREFPLRLFDSGATHHLSAERKFFTSLTQLERPLNIIGISGTQTQALFKGSLQLPVFTSRGRRTLTIPDVYYVPGLGDTLISMPTLMKRGHVVHLEDMANPHLALFSKGSDVITVPIRIEENNVMHFPNPDNPDVCEFAEAHGMRAAVGSTSTLWHQRLHVPDRVLTNIHKHVDGVPQLQALHEACDACLLGRSTRHPVSKKGAERPPVKAKERVHVDIVGPFPTSNVYKKANYCAVFVDEFSRFVTAFPMLGKRNLLPALQAYIADHKPTAVFSDGEPLMIEGKVRDELLRRGIQQRYSPHHKPALNGIVERAIRTTVTDARTHLLAAKLPDFAWPYALLYGVYVRNRLPKAKWEDPVTPYERFTGQRPNFEHLHTFGCVAYASKPELQLRGKMTPSLIRAIFLGYDPLSPRACFIYKPETRTVVSTGDLKFDESSIGYPTLVGKDADPQYFGIEDFDPDAPQLSSDDESAISHSEGEDDEPAAPARRSTRLRARASLAAASHHIEDPLPVDLSDQLTQAPLSYKQAMASADRSSWRAAMDLEMAAHHSNGTWEYVAASDLPHGAKILGNQWVFALKTDSDGQVIRYKARIVVLGNHQRPGIDYKETFAPTVAAQTLRTFIAVAASRNLATAQLDVSTAYLNAPVTEEIFMRLPQGYEGTEVDEHGRPKYCRLLRSLYGLCQSGHNWHEWICDRLANIGFRQSLVDPGLHIATNKFLTSEGEQLYLLLHVDDMPCAGSSANILLRFRDHLSRIVKLTYETPLNWCLGLKIDFMAGDIILSQPKHIQTLLDEHGLTTAHPHKVPADVSTKLTSEMSPPSNQPLTSTDATRYRALVGSLNYVSTLTRPDIAYATNRCASFVANPGTGHITAAKRIAKYLKGTQHLGLRYRKDNNLEVEVFVDADWASNEGRNSITGYIVTVGGTPVAWASRKQKVIALSSTEAEYIAASAAVTEVLFIRQLLRDFDINITKPIIIREDNRGCIDLVNRSCTTPRSKHIDIRHHFMRQHVKDGIIKFEHIPTKDQLADTLTKPATIQGLQLFTEMLMATTPSG